MGETTANEFRKRLKHYVDMSILNHDVLKINRRFKISGKRTASNTIKESFSIPA